MANGQYWSLIMIGLVATSVAKGTRAQPSNATASARPFSIGERLSYNVYFGPKQVGSGSMHVVGIDTIRGRPAYHATLRIKGGVPSYEVDDTFESWFAIDDFSSLRYNQDQNEGSRKRAHRYEIFPERRVYDDLTDEKPEQPSVAEPLDDGSFLYFLRTVPLEIGQTYEFQRYYKPDRNPVRIRVLRRERVTVPAGTFDAVVIQPIIKTKGAFSDGGRAEVWMSDDGHRMIVQMKSQLSFGSINLYLKSVGRP
jgi:hypothetical protein